MAEIPAALVVKLRKMSGQGMMDCKKALEEANGDIDAAMAILRKKGLATLAKRAERETTQGLVVSKAGFGLKGGFATHGAAQLDAMLNVNARAPLLLLHGLLPGLMRRAAAGIILTGSQEGEAPFPWSAAYAATKAFVHSLGLSLYGELQGTGVDVLVLAPGATDTEALVLQGFDAKKMPGVMTPAEVSRQALDRLGQTPLHVPGAMNRFYVRMFRLLPRRWTIAMAGKGMAMALKQAGHPVSRK